MGAPGHNAAKVVLRDLSGDGAAAAPVGARPGASSKGLIDRLMETEAGRRAGYRLARQPALRPLAKLATRRPKR